MPLRAYRRYEFREAISEALAACRCRRPAGAASALQEVALPDQDEIARGGHQREDRTDQQDRVQAVHEPVERRPAPLTWCEKIARSELRTLLKKLLG